MGLFFLFSRNKLQNYKKKWKMRNVRKVRRENYGSVEDSSQQKPVLKTSILL